MQKAVLLLMLFLAVCVSLFAQKLPSTAPPNPDFVKFMDLQKSGKAPLPGTDEYGTGAMPPPGVVRFDNFPKNNQLKSTSFASVYDLRTLGLVTPVKGQTGGACWAFATMASVESRWLVLGLGAWDLSDNNLKYCHGFDSSRDTWGNHFMSTAYFARRKGPLIEADDVNAASSTCPTGKTPVGYITDARYLPHDMNVIKQAIMDQGAIFTMMYYSVTYFNDLTDTYYYSGTPRVNHAVDLVGWDDNKVTAGGTGAWICKNSYGIVWGEAGYFYVSYNDKGILDYNAYWPVRMDNVPNTRVYGYDSLGYVNTYGYNSPVGYMLVKYSASAKQLLSKVGTYAIVAGTSLEIDVFDTFDPLANTLSGLLSHQEGLSCALPGYYTFDLTTPLVVEQGEDFFVRVRYETPGYTWPIPVECLYAGYAYPDIESNVAWMSDVGTDGSWYFLGATNPNPDYQIDPCVKVYAEPYPETLTWNGSASTDWNIASNWTPASIPNASSDVLIPDVSVKPVVNQGLATPAVCKNLTIDAGSSVTLNADKALTVYGSLTNNGGDNGLSIASGASLITKGTITGTATVNRGISGANWHFISTPVSNATALTFIGKYLQKHTELTNAYTDITSTAEAIVPVKGYALWGDASGFTAQYKGILNTGNQSVAVTRSSSDLYNSGWNLVGNPYPSSIDWDASGWTKTNLYNAIYVENSGGWATYISGVGVTGGSRFIAPGQGFMVRAGATIGSGSLVMNDYVRTHNATTFFKSETVSDSLIRIEVSGNGYTDEAVVRFMPEATAEFDGDYDAFKLFGYIDESAQIYTMGSIPLTINSMPHGISEIPLGIHANRSGEYTIAATHTGDLGDVTFEDIKTGIRTIFPANAYTFTFEAGENEQRFILRFNALSPVRIDETENSFIPVFSSNQNIYINLKNPLKGDILIYNISGQLVDGRFSAEGMNSVRMTVPGIYIVKVIIPEKTIVKKVWVH
ncbi:MAG: C1 family peptidase [Bacteroidales bacterium]|nr:C1 family peptidase [Bacteroidales bacterium]